METRSGAAMTSETKQRGSALVIVLLAIVVLLPMTLILSKLAMRWQRQAMDFRDTIHEEFVAEAALEEAMNRIRSDTLDLAPEQESQFQTAELGGLTADAFIARQPDVVLTLSGSILQGAEAADLDIDVAGVDAEGRVVYRYRKLEIYLVRVNVNRRPSLPGILLYGVVGKRQDASVELLGRRLDRRY